MQKVNFLTVTTAFLSQIISSADVYAADGGDYVDDSDLPTILARLAEESAPAEPPRPASVIGDDLPQDEISRRIAEDEARAIERGFVDPAVLARQEEIFRRLKAGEDSAAPLISSAAGAVASHVPEEVLEARRVRAESDAAFRAAEAIDRARFEAKRLAALEAERIAAEQRALAEETPAQRRKRFADAAAARFEAAKAQADEKK